MQEKTSEQAVMGLGTALLYYGAALLFFWVVLSVILQFKWSGWLILLAYLAIGAALNHLVLKRLIEWHPMYNTLDNVSSAKLKAVLFWPLSYGVLLIKLAIDKAL